MIGTEASAWGAELCMSEMCQGGKAMGKLQQDLASQPAFDSAKVAAIKEAIANGSYRVDPEKLADNIMKFEKELS